ncbi:hypothetical protein BDQ17DRAFT_1355183 [Cyathus striatus]|nr:hypothetical protein BDQ17DRAFT_1355183 [Cyathus striatus]
MSRRGNTPLGSLPSLEASNQAQINDLVERNRGLERNNQRLTEQLAAETARCKDAVNDARKQWEAMQQDWRQGCDELLSCHRLVQQQTIVELHKERTNVVREQELLRQEKLERLRRDYRITLFQAREAELEDRIARLVTEFEIVIEQLKQKCVSYATVAKKREKEVAEQKKNVPKRSLQASLESTKSKLERTQLQLDGSQTKLAEMERLNEELKRTNSDLTRQMDKWQTLETKGGEEAETQRKKRIELELQLKTLKEQYEKDKEEDERLLAREKRRVDKMKETVHQWQESLEEEKGETEAAKNDLAEAEKHIKKLNRELEVLRTKAADHGKKRRPTPIEEEEEEEEVASQIQVEPSPPMKPKSRSERPSKEPVVAASDPESKKTRANRKGKQKEKGKGPGGETETEAIEPPVPKTKPKPRPKARPLPLQKEEEEEEKGPESEVESEASKPRAPKTKPKPKPLTKPPPPPSPTNNSEIEEISPAPGKDKRKGKVVKEISEPVKSKGKRNAAEDIPESKAATKANGKGATKGQDLSLPSTTNKGKRKASDRDTEDSEIEIVGERSKPRKPAGRKAPSIAGRARSVQPQAKETTASDEELAPKRKKRKINIFPNTLMDGGFNIPTILSPVKESDPVPGRSTVAGSVAGSVVGSKLASRLTARR